MSEVSVQYSMLEYAYQTVKNALHTTADGTLVGEEDS